jgi:hypothetical protein
MAAAQSEPPQRSIRHVLTMVVLCLSGGIIYNVVLCIYAQRQTNGAGHNFTKMYPSPFSLLLFGLSPEPT